MRRTACRIAAFTLLGMLLCLAGWTGLGPGLPLLTAQAAAKQANPAIAGAKAAEAADAETVDISGRIAVGLDKVFIKDAQGYCLVQGLDLAPFAGRHIQARAIVLRSDKDYRTVRLLDYRVASPDDESPGAARTPAPIKPQKKQ